jgi:hypothetical protein
VQHRDYSQFACYLGRRVLRRERHRDFHERKIEHLSAARGDARLKTLMAEADQRLFGRSSQPGSRTEPARPAGATLTAVAQIASKNANALIEDAQANALACRAAKVGSGTTSWINRFRQRHGGLWVGGRLTLETTSVEFQPNTVNRSLQSGSLDVVIDLRQVESVELLPGFVTKVVAVRTADRVFKARCFGAGKLVDQIRSAVHAARNAPL